MSTVNSRDVTVEPSRRTAPHRLQRGLLRQGVQLYAQDQAIFLRTAATGPANLIVESNTGGANDGAAASRTSRGSRSCSSASDPGQPELAHAGLHRERGPGESWARRCAASSWTRSWGSSRRSTTTCCVLWGVCQRLQARAQALEKKGKKRGHS